MLILAAALALLAAGCSSSFTPGVTEPFIDLTGNYRSTSSVGSMGTLLLRLERIESSAWFDAMMDTDFSDEINPSIGFANLGDHHVVIDMDRGLLTEYYFEGEVVMDGDSVDSLSGRFVWPDMEETLDVTFEKI